MSLEKKAYTCPNCGTKGDTVGNATIKCLISVSLHRVKDVEHRFCENVACDVVYFAVDGSEVFHTVDLREQVYQKEPENPDVLVCYCFFHSLGDIQADVATNGKSAIVDDIKRGIQAGHCACDWRNPQGTCCLGNVLQIVKAAKPL
jgi:hypothetical protein